MDKPERRDTGVFANDAPALFCALGRMYNKEILKSFEELYHNMVLAGGLHEGAIARAPNASFNPRPARLCKILLRETNEQDVNVLGAALIIAVPDNFETPVAWQAACELAKQARTFRAQPLSKPDAPIERLHLAVLLDDLRHLHMTTLPHSEKEALVEHFEQVYQNGCKHCVNTPLLKAALSAAKRVRIHLFNEDLST